jgi:hypothetical protein
MRPGPNDAQELSIPVAAIRRQSEQEMAARNYIGNLKMQSPA